MIHHEASVVLNETRPSGNSLTAPESLPCLLAQTLLNKHNSAFGNFAAGLRGSRFHVDGVF